MEQQISVITIRDFAKRWLRMHRYQVDQMRETVLVKNNDLFGYRFQCQHVQIDWRFGDTEATIMHDNRRTVVSVSDQTRKAA